MMVDATVYPLPVLRAVILHQQRLDLPHGETPDPTPDAMTELVAALGCVQIDTLHVVNRAHYLTMWARFGNYDISDFDALLYNQADRRLFEHWGHAASIIPLEHFRYYQSSMHYRRDNPSDWWRDWLAKPESREVLDHVRSRIQEEGGLRSADFKYDGPVRDSWFDWKPAKRALEMLFAHGELLVTDRVRFQRVYDLHDRVLPDWVDTEPVTREESLRYHVEESMRATGICRPDQVAEYAYMFRRTAKPIVTALMEEGVFVPVRGELLDGTTADLIIHRDNLPLLARAADGEITPRRTTFLAPFDSLFWGRDRDQEVWGFRQVLECYKPADQRIWGYFSLPILHRDRLVGRFDPKLERKTGTLRLKALYLEEGVDPSDELVADVAATMRDFMAFHEATELVIESSDPAAFGKKLERAL